MNNAIIRIEGTLLPLPGDDIDTDQIMPSRYLTWVTFVGIERHVFEDARRQAREAGQIHPLDDPSHKGAGILLVNSNFGCGSSREHAPQALRRHGIRVIVGVSFGEIFASNCTAIGMPCVQVARDVAQMLQSFGVRHPHANACLDLAAMTLAVDGMPMHVCTHMREGPRRQLLNGRWDSLSLLMEASDQTREKLRELRAVA